MERTDVEAETPILWPPDVKSWLIWKDPDAGKDWRQEEKGTTEDEVVGWHHWHNGHGLGWAPGVGDGQGGLACCGSWGCRVRHDWGTELKCRRVPFLHILSGTFCLNAILFIFWYILWGNVLISFFYMQLSTFSSSVMEEIVFYSLHILAYFVVD